MIALQCIRKFKRLTRVPHVFVGIRIPFTYVKHYSRWVLMSKCLAPTIGARHLPEREQLIVRELNVGTVELVLALPAQGRGDAWQERRASRDETLRGDCKRRV